MELASEKQLAMYKKNGWVIPEGLTKSEAFKTIKAFFDAKDTVSQNPAMKAQAGPTTNTSIIRQNVLNRAIDLVCADKIALDQWDQFAEEFEKWVTR